MSLKSQRSDQDYLSRIETQFLESYLLNIIQNETQDYLVDSELQFLAKYDLIDICSFMEEKRAIIQQPNNYFFAIADFHLDDLIKMLQVKLDRHRFKDDKYLDQVKTKSPDARRKLFLQLKTSSFGEPDAGATNDTLIKLNDHRVIVKENDVLLVIPLIKITKLNEIQTIVTNAIHKLQKHLKQFILRFNSTIIPVVFINADINYDYQSIPNTVYYISKQILVYHFYDNQQLKVDPESITDGVFIDYKQQILQYKMRRVSNYRSRLLTITQDLQKHQNDILERNRLKEQARRLKISIILPIVMVGVYMIFKRQK